MFVNNSKIPLFYLRAILSESLRRCQFMYYNRKIDTVAKRASVLKEMITNKDKRKNWHFNIVTTKPKARVFDKIHRPHRRRTVLNTLFIRNITDVLSTGEIVPELSNFGVEITGVQVSPCYKTLNVFWQVPKSHYDSCEDIGKLLSIAAPRIRAELISRNVLGRVPYIFFLRDGTNAKISEFEQALAKLDSEPKFESCIVADDAFTKDIYAFKDSKVKSTLESPEPVKIETKKDLTIPKMPVDMKCDVFGLNHDAMMEKVAALKKKSKSPPQHTAVITPDSLTSQDDLFSKIPGIRFKPNTPEDNVSREAIIKKFYIERKMLKFKNKIIESVDNHQHYEMDSEEGDNTELRLYDDEDFFEDESTDN